MKAAYLRDLKINPVSRLLFKADTFIFKLKNGIIRTNYGEGDSYGKANQLSNSKGNRVQF